MNSRKSIQLFVMLVGLSMVLGHSQMRCAKYNKVTGACDAPIRNAGVSFMQEAYLYAPGAPICQSAISNPITESYANGPDCPSWAPCPAGMGSFARGEQFTVQWVARNHATDNQEPATVKLYMSPKESATAGADVSKEVMEQNLVCTGPFKNCGGVNVDLTPCTLDCVMPNVADGYYTFWWKWDWQTKAYATCADIIVAGGSASGSTPPPPSAPATTAAPAPVTTARATTAAPAPATTARATTGSTTGRAASTTARAATTAAPAAATTARSTTAAVAQGTTTGAVNNGGSTSCTLGYQQCVGTASSGQYQSCGWASQTATGWINQSCPAGLKCKPHPVYPSYIWCS